MASIETRSESRSSTDPQTDLLAQIIEIQDPEINVPEILNQIRANMAQRKVQGLTLGSWVLSEERLALRAAHEKLKVRVHYYGTIGEPQAGLKGQIQFFFKRIILKLIRRHIDQEKEVQESLLKLIDRLIPYLDQCEYAKDTLQRVELLEKKLDSLSKS